MLFQLAPKESRRWLSFRKAFLGKRAPDATLASDYPGSAFKQNTTNSMTSTPNITRLSLACCVVVPQQMACLVERLGRFQQVLSPGFHFLVPFVDRIAYVHSLKETAIPINNQSAITKDNVTIQLDGVLYMKVDDPYAASYGVEDPIFAVTQLAQTTMRSELGKLTLDATFLERESLNETITNTINSAASNWGIRCMRYEIRDIVIPSSIRQAMEKQAEAERRKRADILMSEAEQQMDINIACGRKQSMILKAEGEAQVILQRAQATSSGLRSVAKVIQEMSHGEDAVAMQLAEQYIEAFGNLAKEATTVIVPTNVSDPSNFVTQALTVFHRINSALKQQTPHLRSPELNTNPTIGATTPLEKDVQVESGSP